MKRRLATILVAVTLLLVIAPTQAGVPGDVTGDGSVNVADVQCTVLKVLKPDPPGCLANADAADLNCDDKANVADVQLSVLIVLKHPQPGVPADKDANGNNIVDACEQAGCPDGECAPDETCDSCPEDCAACCGNDFCDEAFGENEVNCPADCKIDPGDYNQGDIVITEIMKNPSQVSDANGEWFEVRNMKAGSFDLKNWVIKDAGGESHTINKTVNLGGSSVIVLGRNSNKAENCNVTMVYQYSGITLDDTEDEVILVAPDGTEIDRVEYDASFPKIPGKSMSLASNKYNYLLNDTAGNWCVGTTYIHPVLCQDWGSPGMMNSMCVPQICGNGNVEPGEQCEPPNTATCTADCQIVINEDCGDGKLDAGEDCEPPNTETCDANCKTIVPCLCGNLKLEPECDEECDDGNYDDGDGCTWDCQFEAVCGNGDIELGEDCDPPDPDAEPPCDAFCKIIGDPKCGDGVKGGSEECDDGNTEPGDGCDGSCQLEGGIKLECGNGIVQEANDEECDDGNTENGDGCNDSCKIENPCQGACCPMPCCGDGTTDNGTGGTVDLGEECDDMNLDNGDGCSDQCKFESGLLMGISGSATYMGTPSPADLLMVGAYKNKPVDCEDAGEPIGGFEAKPFNKNEPFEISLSTAGTYYLAACVDIGGNGLGDEDCGFVYPDAIFVGKNEVVESINLVVPECTGQASGGEVCGTISLDPAIAFTPGPTNKDSMSVMINKQLQGAPTKVGEVTKGDLDYPYDYCVSGIAPGKYYVIGVFDKNDDTTQAPKPGDMMGIYESFDNQVKITVVDGETIGGIDFTIDSDPP